MESFKALGRIKGSDVWEVMEAYPDSIRPYCEALSGIPVTQVSAAGLGI